MNVEGIARLEIREPGATPVARDELSFEDEALVARARRGDERAFAALHAKYCRLVHALAVAHGAAREADDVEQEVFLAAFRSLGSLRSDEHFGGWIAQIARHRATRVAMAARTRGRTAALEHDVVAHDSVASCAATTSDVLRVLESLPEAYRETLALRLVEGLSGPEIAALTGLTHGSVRVNLTRGMELLRSALRERGWT